MLTNEELKKKIVEIINDGIIHGEDNFGMPTSKTIENIADALIAAGIGDVSELKNHRIIAEYSLIPEDGNSCVLPDIPLRITQLYSGEEVENILKERNELKVELRDKVDYIHEQDEVIKEYKHRAEVAEKAGRIIQRDMARVFDVSNPRICELIANIWDLAKKQAEKELAEERKDD